MSLFTPNASSRPRAFAALAALGVLTAAVALASPAASAGEPWTSTDGMQTTVYYTWQDLATERGTRALYGRIVQAAEEECPGSDSLYLNVAAESRACQRKVIARAIGEIGSQRLAAIDAQAVARSG